MAMNERQTGSFSGLLPLEVLQPREGEHLQWYRGRPAEPPDLQLTSCDCGQVTLSLVKSGLVREMTSDLSLSSTIIQFLMCFFAGWDNYSLSLPRMVLIEPQLVSNPSPFSNGQVTLALDTIICGQMYRILTFGDHKSCDESHEHSSQKHTYRLYTQQYFGVLNLLNPSTDCRFRPRCARPLSSKI